MMLQMNAKNVSVIIMQNLVILILICIVKQTLQLVACVDVWTTLKELIVKNAFPDIIEIRNSLSTIHNLVEVKRYLQANNYDFLLIFLTLLTDFQECKCDLIGTIMSPNKTDVCSETECVCKINVEGKSCDRCKPGFWNLDLRNKIYGCKECSCLYIGTVDNYGCNTTTGLCAACKKFVTGKKCDKCLPGYYGLSVINKHGCKPCNCHKSFSYSSNCDETTGQCSCKPHTTGIRCENIESNFFCPSLDHLVYEAESAGVLNSYVKPYEKSESSASPGSLGWTGSGFMRVYPTGGLKFNIDFEMKSGIYDILIRYESLMHTWSNVEVLVRNRGLDCERYENSTMLHGNRNHKMCSFYRPEQSFIERNLVTLEKSTNFYLLLNLIITLSSLIIGF